MQLLRHLVSGRDFLLPTPALPLLLSSLSSSAFRLCKKKIGTYLTINTLFVSVSFTIYAPSVSTSSFRPSRSPNNSEHRIIFDTKTGAFYLLKF